MTRVQFTQKMATRMRSGREKHNMSQYVLAEKTGVPRASIKRWECFEVQTIDSETLKRVEKVIGKVSGDSPAPAKTAATQPVKGRDDLVVQHLHGLPGDVAALRIQAEKIVALAAKKKSTLRYYRVTVSTRTHLGHLRGFVEFLLLLDRRVVVSGRVAGLEPTVKQTKQGYIEAGESVVVALLSPT